MKLTTFWTMMTLVWAVLSIIDGLISNWIAFTLDLMGIIFMIGFIGTNRGWWRPFRRWFKGSKKP
jgi:hypothetical protein